MKTIMKRDRVIKRLSPYLPAELAVTASGGLTKPSWPSRSAVVSSSTHKRRAERRAGPVGERCREVVLMTYEVGEGRRGERLHARHGGRDHDLRVGLLPAVTAGGQSTRTEQSDFVAYIVMHELKLNWS